MNGVDFINDPIILILITLSIVLQLLLVLGRMTSLNKNLLLRDCCKTFFSNLTSYIEVILLLYFYRYSRSILNLSLLGVVKDLICLCICHVRDWQLLHFIIRLILRCSINYQHMRNLQFQSFLQLLPYHHMSVLHLRYCILLHLQNRVMEY